MRRIPMHMVDWIKKLDGFLTLNDRSILTNAGRISHEMALEKAEREYVKFKAVEATLPQPVDRDFERAIQDVNKLSKPKKPKLAKS